METLRLSQPDFFTAQWRATINPGKKGFNKQIFYRLFAATCPPSDRPLKYFQNHAKSHLHAKRWVYATTMAQHISSPPITEQQHNRGPLAWHHANSLKHSEEITPCLGSSSAVGNRLKKSRDFPSAILTSNSRWSVYFKVALHLNQLNRFRCNSPPANKICDKGSKRLFLFGLNTSAARLSHC